MPVSTEPLVARNTSGSRDSPPSISASRTVTVFLNAHPRANGARPPGARPSAESWRRIACSSSLQRLARFDAQLVDERAPRLAVRLESLDLPARAV